MIDNYSDIQEPKPKKLSVQDFAKKIKAKYPDYKDVPDDELTNKIITKYPEYKEQVDFPVQKKNLGEPQSTPVSKDLQGGGYNGTTYTTNPDENKEPLPTIEMYQTSKGDVIEPDAISMSKKAAEYLKEGDYVGSGGTGGGTASFIPNKESVNAGNKIIEDLKKEGFDFNKLNQDFGDLPDYVFNAQGLTKPELLEKYKNNPQQYERNIATMKWQSKINDALTELPEDKKRFVHEELMKDLNNSDVGDFNQQRGTIKRIVDTVNKYGGDKKEEIIKNLGIDFSDKYGFATADVMKNTEDPLFKNLNSNQLIAYHYLEDFLPKEANKYKSALLDEKDVKDNFEANLSREESQKRLEELGIQLKKNAAQEHLNKLLPEYNNLLNKESLYGLEPEEQSRKIELEQQGKPLSDLIRSGEIDEENIVSNYPKASYLDANNFAQELIGQKHTGLDWLAIESGKATENTAKGAWNFLSRPFRSDLNNEINQAEILGGTGLNENSAYLTQGKQMMQSFKPEISPELQSKIDEIKKDDNLSHTEKLDKVTDLLVKSGGQWRRTPIQGGQTNIGITSLMYGVGGLAANLAPFMALETLTGGGASASATKKLTSAFTSAAATSFQDMYVQALQRGSDNPYKDAMVSTVINSAALAGAATPDAIRKLLGSKGAIGDMVVKLTDDEIMAALKNEPKALSQFKKSLEVIKKSGINAGKNFGNAFTTGARVSSITTGAQVANDAINNELKNPEDYAKQAAIETLKFTTLGSVGVVKNLLKPTDLSLGNIIEAAKRPEGYYKALESMEKNGTISVEDANQVRSNIEKVSDIYKKSPILKNPNISPKDVREYLYNKLVSTEAKKNISDLPPKEAEKAEHIAAVAEAKNDLILNPLTDKQLQARADKIEKELIPEKNADGKNKTIKDEAKLKAELEAVNSEVETRASFEKVKMDRKEFGKKTAEQLLEPHKDHSMFAGMNTEQKLKFIADQAQGVQQDGSISKLGNGRGAMETQFGKELVDAAIEKYPAQQGKEVSSTVSEGGEASTDVMEKGKVVPKYDENEIADFVKNSQFKTSPDGKSSYFNINEDKQIRITKNNKTGAGKGYHVTVHEKNADGVGYKNENVGNIFETSLQDAKKTAAKIYFNETRKDVSNNVDISDSKGDYTKIPTDELKKQLEKTNDFSEMAAIKKELDSRKPSTETQPTIPVTKGEVKNETPTNEETKTEIPDTETGSSDIPPTNGKATPKAEEGEVDPEMTKMANAINDAHVEGKFGVAALDKVLSKLEDTDLKKIYETVKKKIQQGVIDLKRVRERLITTKQGSEADQAALLYDLAELKGKEKLLQQEIINSSDPKLQAELQKQLLDVQNDMMDNALANRSLGRTASTIFRLRQLWVNKETDLADFQEQYKAAKKIKELSPEQEKIVKDAYLKIRELKAKAEKARGDLEKSLAENEKLRAENEQLEKLKQTATKQKKADRGKKADESIKKSQERIDKAKENLKRLRSGMNDVTRVVPATAIEISKIAAERVYQGVVKFDELVRNVLDDIKDIFPEWTEKDVRAHLIKTDAEKYYEGKTDFKNSTKELQEKVKVYKDAQKEYATKMFEWQRDRRSDMMSERPLKDRILDNILRWQRFAVLSYPSTFVKLAAVVGQQLTLKPLKLAIQKIVHTLTPKSITDKQSIWGNPTWKALGKYYSALIRNLSLQNLKEQFSGVDTKEILYGKGMMYEEWGAAKGFLEMPGRSHGYVKSFIKNPEFQYAHEMQITHSISKMAEIENKLKNENLSAEEKTKLEQEYEMYDVTKEDVMERINKLSLEHGKWSILMNDNKFVEKFRQWTNNNGIAGALIKSELPIVKIPVNYVGRTFAIKYGLIRAIAGKGRWEGGEHFPGVVEMIMKGTKDLTPEQADLFSKALNLGSMGAAFFVLGYIGKNQVHHNDDGSYEIFGQHISKNLVHSPELESIFSGANTAHNFEEKGGKGAGKWIEAYVESDMDIASKNPFANMLKYGFLPNVASALLSKNSSAQTTTGKITDAIAKKFTDMTVPGAVKQSAQWWDTNADDNYPHPMKNAILRKPEGTNLERAWQTFEMAIPGLRKNVPEKSTTKKSKPQKQEKKQKSEK